MKRRNPRPHEKSPTIRTDWGEAADWYDKYVGDTGSEFHQKIINPGVLRLLGLKPQEKAIDVACGQGVLCRAMQLVGAEVTGIDAAEPLIAAARTRGPAAIHYHVADARDLNFLPENHFTAGACVLAIQNIHPIQPVF